VIPLRLRTAVAALAAVLVWLSAAPALSDAEVYKPRHRLASELLPIAEAALGAEGRVVLDPATNSLVMLGPPSVVAQARALLEQMDSKLHSVVIQYQQQRSATLDSSGVAVRWSTTAGPIRIGNVVSPDGETGIAVGAASSGSKLESERSGTLRVLDGATGRIETGTRIPYEVGTGNRRTTTFVDAASGFEVRPRVLGDGRVRLALRPFGAQPTADGRIAYSGADTIVEVRPGETVVIGGVGGGIDMRRQGTRGSASRSGDADEVLLISVRTE
jgi:type II secretory pathway component GspD/PulD (secretin)